MKLRQAPFFVWRRDDGYVGCTRYMPISAAKFELLGQFKTWLEAKPAMDEARKDERHIALVESWDKEGVS